MGKKTIFRSVEVEKDPYTRIRNDAIQEEDLSWKATGLLVYLLSLPDDWKAQVAHLKTVKTDGRDATRSGLDELRDAGYVHRFQRRGEDGKIDGLVYLIFNESVSRSEASRIGFSDIGNPDVGDPDVGNPTSTNNTFQQTKKDTNKRERGAHADGRESANVDPPLSEEDAVSVAEEEDISARVARKWWHYQNARGWPTPIKSVRSALIKWAMDEDQFHGNGEVQTPEDLKGGKYTESEIGGFLEKFEDLSRSDFVYAQDERGGNPLYTLSTENGQ